MGFVNNNFATWRHNGTSNKFIKRDLVGDPKNSNLSGIFSSQSKRRQIKPSFVIAGHGMHHTYSSWSQCHWVPFALVREFGRFASQFERLLASLRHDPETQGLVGRVGLRNVAIAVLLMVLLELFVLLLPAIWLGS
jgi:hypothetical protein